MTYPAVQTGQLTQRTIQKARLDSTRRRAELIFRRSARAALEMLRQAIDPERLATALTQYGSYTAIQGLPWEAFGLRLSADFLRIFRDVYEAAGDQAAAKLKARLIGKDVAFEVRVRNWGFDVLNQRGLEYLRRYGGARITQISNETRQALRIILAEAYNQGLPALETAKRIKTEIGLTTQHAQAVENLRTRLEDEGTPPARVDVLVARKARELLDLRALNIARTEATFAASAGQRESLREAAEQGLFDPQQAVRVWVTAEDEQVCPICEPLDGVESDGLDGTWMTEDGPVSDPPAHVNCRCDTDLRI